MKNADIYEFINEIYKNDRPILDFLIPHSESVAKFAVEIAKKKNADINFVERAALLHDIGIIFTDTPKLHCKGKYHYMQHGIYGRKLLEENGFVREAIVAQTHIGVAITAEHIIKNNLPLPPEDMCPTTLEEEIVSFADKFYSKRTGYLTVKKTLTEVEKDIKQHGNDSYQTFKKWLVKFS